MTRTDTLTRRAFLAMAGAAPLAASALAQSKTVPVGLELYSVRGDLMKDIPGTVRAVAKMGYQVVEFYSPYFKWTTEQAKEVRALLDELGVKCHSTHNGGESISPEGMPRAIELNRIIGSTAIVLASPGKVTGPDYWKTLADRLNKAADALRNEGMRVGFHNHQLEFRRAEDGTRPMDVLAANTSKDVILQLDAGTAVEVGADPVAWIKANPGRIRSIHLKEWSKTAGYDVAFGEGEVPWKGIFDAAESVGGIEYYLIEQERAGAIGEIAMVQKCLDNYKKMRGA